MKRVFIAAAALCWSSQAIACDPDLIKALQRMASALESKEAQTKPIDRPVSGEDQPAHTFIPRTMIRTDRGEHK